jgi:DNA polymerase-1
VCSTLAAERGKLWNLTILYHDEYNGEAESSFAETLASEMAAAITRAGEFFKLHCPLEGEAKIGKSWRDVH